MARSVAKKKPAKIAVMSEDMFAADAGVGVNDLGSEDLAIPFLKVLQKILLLIILNTSLLLLGRQV